MDDDTLTDYVNGAVKYFGPLLTGDVAVSDEEQPAEDEATMDANPTSIVITRPNGEAYRTRTVKIGATVVQDVDVITQAAKHKMPVLLYGPPGTGKTAMVEAALQDIYTVQGTVETETADFEGSWIQNADGTFAWVDGPLVKAMEEGKPLLIDEIALIDPRVLSVVYSVMDGRDTLPITANPARGVVQAKDGFMVFGACNPHVPGALMSDALLSRFKLHVHVTSDWEVAASLGVGSKIIQVARNLALKASSSQLSAAPQLRELLTFRDTRAVFGLEIALDNFVTQAREEDREAFSDAIRSVFGKTPSELKF